MDSKNTNGYTNILSVNVTDNQLTSHSIPYSNGKYGGKSLSGEYYYHINYVLNQPSTYYSF